MIEKKHKPRKTSANAIMDIKENSVAGIPVASDEGVEEARDWVNEHEL